MYAVVGCSDCGTLWLLSDPDAQETATCARCGSRHRVDKLRRFYETEDRAAARQARAALLAEKHGDSDSFAELDHVAELERQVESAGIDDREYLSGAGLDPDAVEAAGDRAAGGGGSRSREAVVREAVRQADGATVEGVVERAREEGVPEDVARDLLERLVRHGEATESGGEYRLL